MGFIITKQTNYINISNNGQTVINVNKPFNATIADNGNSILIFDVTGIQRISIVYSTVQTPSSTSVYDLQNKLMSYNN